MRQLSVAPPLPLLRKFPTDEATQGVAVSHDHFYAINNANIGKYERATGKKVGTYKSSPERPLIHMDGGLVLGKTLYCSHSNFPETPMLSSIERFDTATLKHIGSQSFGRDAGSLTWLDWHESSWWVCFGHYNGKGGEMGKTNQDTVLVRYDPQWRKQAAYVFPTELFARWEGMTPRVASGGLKTHCLSVVTMPPRSTSFGFQKWGAYWSSSRSLPRPQRARGSHLTQRESASFRSSVKNARSMNLTFQGFIYDNQTDNNKTGVYAH